MRKDDERTKGGSAAVGVGDGAGRIICAPPVVRDAAARGVIVVKVASGGSCCISGQPAKGHGQRLSSATIAGKNAAARACRVWGWGSSAGGGVAANGQLGKDCRVRGGVVIPEPAAVAPSSVAADDCTLVDGEGGCVPNSAALPGCRVALDLSPMNVAAGGNAALAVDPNTAARRVPT